MSAFSAPVCVLLCATAWTQATSRVSVDSAGAESDDHSHYLSISEGGRWVAFESSATNLVPGDTNLHWDVFVHDRSTGSTERVSVGSSGAEGDQDSHHARISRHGEWVVFESAATNLVANDTNGLWDVFVHDRRGGETARVSLTSDEGEAHGRSFRPSISDDGRVVAFYSDADDLVPDDTNDATDAFLRDLWSGRTVRISVGWNGEQADGHTGHFFIPSPPALSAGSLVAFFSTATNLVPDDTNGVSDVFVHDLRSGRTVRASLGTAHAQADAGSYYPTISADGRRVAFSSYATNLGPPDANFLDDVFVRDLVAGTTTLAGKNSAGIQAVGSSTQPAISADGRRVAFLSSAANLVHGDTNRCEDVFVHDLATRATWRASVGAGGEEADHTSFRPVISATGSVVAFGSNATNLVPSDTNAVSDVFVRLGQH